MPGALGRIKHVVVAMLENRSFDNLAGYFYAADKNVPPIVLPPGRARAYDGLFPLPPDPALNPFWNPDSAAFFNGGAWQPVFATERADNFSIPDPDPEEYFADMTYQLFGPEPPAPTAKNQMKGFYVNYAKASATPRHIMQCYAAGQVAVMLALARNFAISDEWYASSPTQTWPNRAFVHLGTSLGKVDNWPYDPLHYDVATIFNTLENAGHSWAVYNDADITSLTRLQLPRLWHSSLDGRFRGFDKFKDDARSGTLPQYSFVEPRFVHLPLLGEPNDQHPPHNVALGDLFIHDIWHAVSTGKNWNETLMVLTYDEHGGCYDHARTRFGAASPDKASDPGEDGFRFERFGVRVPTILVSPWIAPGTVFRTDRTAPYTPYDHTSILATLRDWLKIPQQKMPPSRRTQAAPLLDQVLTLDSPRTDIPDIGRPAPVPAEPVDMSAPASQFQRSIAAAAAAYRLGRALSQPELAALTVQVNTRGEVADFLATNAPRGN